MKERPPSAAARLLPLLCCVCATAGYLFTPPDLDATPRITVMSSGEHRRVASRLGTRANSTRTRPPPRRGPVEALSSDLRRRRMTNSCSWNERASGFNELIVQRCYEMIICFSPEVTGRRGGGVGGGNLHLHSCRSIQGGSRHSSGGGPSP